MNVAASACIGLSCVLAANAALADVIFSNFGPGNSYTRDYAFMLSGPDNGQGLPALSWAFQFRTPAQATYRVDQVVVPFQNFEGEPGPFSVTLSLRQDQNGRPGSVIEGINYTGPLPTGFPWYYLPLPAPLVFASTAHPTLGANTAYWLSAAVPGGNPYVIDWNQNSIGAVGLFSDSQDIGRTVQAAFSVQGSLVPEPGTVALTIAGLLALSGFVRAPAKPA